MFYADDKVEENCASSKCQVLFRNVIKKKQKNLKGVFTSENVESMNGEGRHEISISSILSGYSHIHFHIVSLPLTLTLGYTVMTEDQCLITKRFCWVYRTHQLRWLRIALHLYCA